jgi:preprotein translocase subunit SecA
LGKKNFEIEFRKIYNLVVGLFYILPPKRLDLIDLLYKDQFSKWNAIAQFVIMFRQQDNLYLSVQQPLKSDMCFVVNESMNFLYQILNANQRTFDGNLKLLRKQEKSNITMATNMAGRGTGIILGR